MGTAVNARVLRVMTDVVESPCVLKHSKSWSLGSRGSGLKSKEYFENFTVGVCQCEGMRRAERRSVDKIEMEKLARIVTASYFQNGHKPVVCCCNFWNRDHI